jgi:hypothetical protein
MKTSITSAQLCKVLFVLLVPFLIANCTHKPKPSPAQVSGASSYETDLSFLSHCSQIRTFGTSLWLLTCQRPPHTDRTEIYEWNVDSKILRRLTFQDGQIWDLAPRSREDFYYSSSYDEFKEQFASILQGAQMGSEIYLKNRSQTSFQRMTRIKGLETSLWFDSTSQLLYFVHEIPGESQILTMNRLGETSRKYSVSNKTLRYPFWLKTAKSLVFLEMSLEDPIFRVKSLGPKKRISDLLISQTKIFQLSPGLSNEDFDLGFITPAGIEIWNLNLKDGCWKRAYQTSDPVTEFYFDDNQTLFLTIKGSLRREILSKAGANCQPPPPGVEVTAP